MNQTTSWGGRCAWLSSSSTVDRDSIRRRARNNLARNKHRRQQHRGQQGAEASELESFFSSDFRLNHSIDTPIIIPVKKTNANLNQRPSPPSTNRFQFEALGLNPE